MKNKLHVLLLSSALVLSLGMAAGCKKDNTPSENPPIEVQKNIAKVAITSEDIDVTEEKPIVLDNKSIVLKAKVTAIDETKDYSKKVTWASSDETVATVKNGTVSILSVSENKEVTITATSEEDTEKKASITLEVVHSPVDFEKSAPYGGIDDSMFVDDGILTVEDSSAYPHLVSADAKGSKFYFEAEIKATAFADDENWAKFGLLVTNNETGLWTGDDASAEIKSLFFFCDAARGGIASGWTQFNTVANNDTFKGWDWGRTLGGAATAEKPVKVGEFVKIGILRNGTQYIYYLEREGVMTPVQTVEYPDIAADETAYVMVAGFKTAMEVKGFKGVSGEATDAYFGNPTSLTITSGNQELYIGDTYQTTYALDTKGYDINKLSFESSDDSIATVDKKGLVTASETKTGTVTITARYGELSDSYEIEVTDDAKAFVQIDGKATDAIWAEGVMQKPMTILHTHKLDDKDYVTAAEVVRATRNKKGVYYYADLYWSDVVVLENDWWQGANFESELKVDGKGTTGQLRFSNRQEANGSSINASAMTAADKQKGMNHFAVEAFVPYASIADGVGIEDVITTWAGGNPGGNDPYAGWRETGNRNLQFKVTDEGLDLIDAATYPYTFRYDGDGAGAALVWPTVEKEAGCVEDGSGKVYDFFSDDVADYVWKATGEHHAKAGTYQSEDGKAPCEGSTSGSYECEVCGERYSVPANPTDHGDHFNEETGECELCHNKVNGYLGVKKMGSTGWTDEQIWAKIPGEHTGDFEVEIKYTIENSNAGDYWRGVLPVIYDPTYALDNGAHVSRVVARFDLWGWVDGGNGLFVSTGCNDAGTEGTSFVRGTCSVTLEDGTAGDFWALYKDNVKLDKAGECTLTIRRVGDKLTWDWLHVSSVNHATFKVSQGCNNVLPEKLAVALSAEDANCVVTSVKF